MRSRAIQPSISAIVTRERVRKYWHILGMLNHLSRNSAPASETSIPLRFEAVAIILHQITSRLSRFRMLRAEQFYVRRVSVRHRVRGYSLICLRERFPPRAMFCVHCSSLDRRRIPFSAIVLTFSISVSFSPFPRTSPFTTLKTFGAGNDLPYSATASVWAE